MARPWLADDVNVLPVIVASESMMRSIPNWLCPSNEDPDTSTSVMSEPAAPSET